jgi:chromosome partitioning protein
VHTIAMVSRKGGTGKSTIAIGLALAAMEQGHKVCLLEADPLGTVWNWRRRRKEAEPPVEMVHDGYELVQRVKGMAQRGITLTIVDTAGGWSDPWAGAVSAADLCLIPVRPSPADIEAAAPTLAAIRRTGKPFAFVLSQTSVRSHRVNRTATDLNQMGVLALPYIVQRNDQQDALGLGLAVTEYARDSKSADEIRALWRWVWARLNGLAPEDAEARPAPVAETPADKLPEAPVALPTVVVPATEQPSLRA